MKVILPIVLVLILNWGCVEQEKPIQLTIENSEEIVYVPGVIDTLPKIRFSDGQVSLNDRCAVRGRKLSKKIPPVYVNGYPVAFC